MALLASTEALPIEATYMPHEAYIRRGGEDWSGITDPKERKKLQNRLNQRARRQRKKQCQRSEPLADIALSMDELSLEDGTEENVKEKRYILQRFSEQAYSSYMYSLCQPTRDHLLRVIRFNVINSLTQNSKILGLQRDWIICESISPFGVPSGPEVPMPSCPPSLVPTRLQRTIPHHPWIDLFPLPRMRDNFLLAVTQTLSLEEEEELYKDLVESGGGGGEAAGWTGMMVWGTPWDPQSWEVTAHFISRWSWLLEGCDEMIVATDNWRLRRGEKRLLLEASPVLYQNN